MIPSQHCMYFIGRDQVQQQNTQQNQHDELKNEQQLVQAESRNETAVVPPSHIRVQNTTPTSQPHTDELTNTSASDQFGWANRQLSRAGCSQHRVSTNNCTLCAAHFEPPTKTPDFTGWYRLEADSHADTLRFGKGWTLNYLTGQQFDVDGFHSSMETMKNIPIGSAYTAMDHLNGNTYILHAHEGLCFFDTMEHSLLPPAQLWDNNIQCDICPKHCTNGESIFGCKDPQTDIHLPFSLYGCISYLPIWHPTENELDSCLHIILTNDAPWHPYASTFHKREQPFTPNFSSEYLGETHDFIQHHTVGATSSHTHRLAVSPMELA